MRRHRLVASARRLPALDDRAGIQRRCIIHFRFANGACETHWDDALAENDLTIQGKRSHARVDELLQRLKRTLYSSPSPSPKSTGFELGRRARRLLAQSAGTVVAQQGEAPGKLEEQEIERIPIAESRRKLFASLGLDHDPIEVPELTRGAAQETHDAATRAFDSITLAVRSAPSLLSISTFCRGFFDNAEPPSGRCLDLLRSNLSADGAIAGIAVRGLLLQRKLARSSARDILVTGATELHGEPGQHDSDPELGKAGEKMLLPSRENIIRALHQEASSSNRLFRFLLGGACQSGSGGPALDLVRRIFVINRNVEGVRSTLSAPTRASSVPEFASEEEFRSLLQAAHDETYPSLSRVWHLAERYPHLARLCIAEFSTFISTSEDFRKVEAMWLEEIQERLQLYDTQQQWRMVRSTRALLEALARCNAFSDSAKVAAASDVYRLYMSNAPLHLCASGDVLLGMLAVVAAAKDQWKTMATLVQFNRVISETTATSTGIGGVSGSSSASYNSQQHRDMQRITGNKRGDKFHSSRVATLFTAFRLDPAAMLTIYLHQIRQGRRMPVFTSAVNIMAFCFVKEAAAKISEHETLTASVTVGPGDATIWQPERSVEMVMSLLWKSRRLPNESSLALLLLQKAFELRSATSAIAADAVLAAQVVCTTLNFCNEVMHRLQTLDRITVVSAAVSSSVQIVAAELVRYITSRSNVGEKISASEFLSRFVPPSEGLPTAGSPKNIERHSADDVDSAILEFFYRTSSVFDKELASASVVSVTAVGRMFRGVTEPNILLVDDTVIQAVARIDELERVKPVAIEIGRGPRGPSVRQTLCAISAALRDLSEDQGSLVLFTHGAFSFLQEMERSSLVRGECYEPWGISNEAASSAMFIGNVPDSWKVIDFIGSVVLAEGRGSDRVELGSDAAANHPLRSAYTPFTRQPLVKHLFLPPPSGSRDRMLAPLHSLCPSRQLDWWVDQQRIHQRPHVPLDPFSRFILQFGHETVPLEDWADRTEAKKDGSVRRHISDFLSADPLRFVEFRFSDEDAIRGCVTWPNVGMRGSK